MIAEIGDILKSDNSGTVSKEEVPLIDSGCYEVPRVTDDGVISGQGQWVEWEACECSARYTPRGGSDVRCVALTMPVMGSLDAVAHLLCALLLRLQPPHAPSVAIALTHAPSVPLL